MKVEEFQNLSDHEQEILIFNVADLVDSFLEGDLIFSLYSIESFFIELRYDLIKYCISSKRIVKDEADLEEVWQHQKISD